MAMMMAVSAGCTFAVSAEADTLLQYAWRQRPLIVISPIRNDPRFKKQESEFSNTGPALLERAIVLIEIVGDQVDTKHGPSASGEAAALRKRLGIKRDEFSVVLLGKDTRVKLRSSEPVSAAAIFSLIDSMPMRRQEMRTQERDP